MNGIDWLGEDGGKLAGAFAAGCIAAFGFLSAVGGWLWKIVGRTRQDRIDELEKAMADDRRRCDAMEQRLVQRIQNLEGMLAGTIRQDAQRIVSTDRIVGDET